VNGQSQCAWALLPNPCAEKAPNFEQMRVPTLLDPKKISLSWK